MVVGCSSYSSVSMEEEGLESSGGGSRLGCEKRSPGNQLGMGIEAVDASTAVWTRGHGKSSMFQ